MRANLSFFNALLCACLLWLPSFAAYTVDLDHAVFRANDSLSYVEIYAAIQKSTLIHDEVGDSLQAMFSLVLSVSQEGKEVLADTFSATYTTSRAELEGHGAFFPHVFRSYLPPGRYELLATLTQKSPREQIRDTLIVRSFPRELSLSDIEMGCWLAVDSTTPSVFEKNSVHILPNATLFWGDQLPMAYFYAEAYGLDFDPAQADSYAVHRQVTRIDDGKKLLTSQSVRRTTGASAVIADGFPVATLRSGAYFLDVQIQDFRSGKIATQRKKFWTFRAGDFAAGRTLPADADLQARLWESVPDIMEVISADSALNVMSYLLTAEEQGQVELLNLEGKKSFLREYWARQEAADPGAGNRYFARVAEANARYKVLHRAGWKTDRGRIFSVYGEPDQVERDYMPSGGYNSEIWHYDRVEGGVIFAFVDYNEYGDLELVHSTKRGEIYNPNWEKQVTGRRHQTPANSNLFEADR